MIMTASRGFQLRKDQYIRELRTRARLYLHAGTGAQLLSLSNEDENKVFGVVFRTPPRDSTGVAHILEHSVLCGSRKYPVKEPFVELLKGSLKTFLNAFTYPDRTCYPVASQNLQDFYNLIDVYMDAVFYPRLTPQVFQQEGWHLELEHASGSLTYKGVVLNEMKGAYSSPDNVLSEYSLQSLFPDNAYGFDSGGDPRFIPDLTYEQFLAFHRKYYHPSNARFYFYGDDDNENRLRLVNAYLREFDPIQVDSAIQLQPSFHAPKRIVRSFLAGEEGGGDTSRGMVTMNWLLSESVDIHANFALRILDYVLLGMPGSPLKKALIDSGLGEAIAGGGLSTELRQMYFSTGLKGINVAHAGKLETIILDTLKNIAETGIDARTVDAAVNTIEFRLRENNSGSFPRGLLLMLRCLTTWLYDGDPLALLAFEKPLEAVKSQITTKEAFFEGMIHRFFVQNPHRTTLVLEPDPGLREKSEMEEKSRLTAIRSAMGPEEIDRLIEQTRELKRIQETADTPEALAAIPVLGIDDLEKKNKIIPLARLDRDGTPVLFHDLFTNGIVYFDLGLNIHTLPDRYLPYVPLFGRCLVEMGTRKEDFVSLSQRINRETGGIRPQILVSAKRDSAACSAWLFLRGKAMAGHGEKLTDLLRDVLLDTRLDDRDRFQQMLLEEKAGTEQRIIPDGHNIVRTRLNAHFGESHWAMEQISGICYLFFLRDLVRAVDENWPAVLAVLEEIRQILINRDTVILNVTAEEQDGTNFMPCTEGLLSALPASGSDEKKWSSASASPFEGLTIPSLVNYVSKGADLYKAGYGFHGSSMVITRYLRNTWLWDQIRVQGGAYGAFCFFDRISGPLVFVSYRDPNIKRTIEIFDQTVRFLLETDLDESDLTKSIVGTIGDLDAYMLPDAKGYASMVRYLIGDTEADRQQMRDEILNTRVSDFRAFAGVLAHVKENGLVKVLGSPDAIEEFRSAYPPGWLDVIKIL